LIKGDLKFDKIEHKLSKQPIISVPSITIDGETDGVTGLSNITKIKQKFSSHIKHQVLPNVGHNVPQEDPQSFSSAILEIKSMN
jgi:pimeloyl-ACP methyl ester carboxylesterase